MHKFKCGHCHNEWEGLTYSCEYCGADGLQEGIDAAAAALELEMLKEQWVQDFMDELNRHEEIPFWETELADLAGKSLLIIAYGALLAVIVMLVIAPLLPV